MDQLLDTKARIKVIDVETTSIDGDPDWIHSANEVVLYGVLDPDWTVLSDQTTIVTNIAANFRHNLGVGFNQTNLLIGHNLMFDIGYLVRKGVYTQRELATSVKIWDTQVAEYILSGQRIKFASLEEVCKAHSVPFTKDPMVVAHFAEGKGADTLPLATLSAYLTSDLRATYAAFMSQYEEASKRGMLPLMWAMMDFRLATIDMRLNSIGIDLNALADTKVACKNRIAVATVAMASSMTALDSCHHYPEHAKLSTLDPTKAPQLANILFGGTRKEKKRVLAGKYKNGKDKYENQETVHTYPGVLHKLGMEAEHLPRSSDESTIDTVLEEAKRLLSGGGTVINSDWIQTLKVLNSLLSAVKEYRKAQKVLSTYVEPTELDASRFGALYPTIQVTATNTGRTSCSGPNLQNVPKNSLGLYRKVIKPLMPAHNLAEFDYSQLEVIALAVLTKDQQLVDDLVHGVDMHRTLFVEVHGRPPTKEERADFKRAVFCLIYGGGVNAVAEQGNTTPHKARQLIYAFRARYPETLRFREQLTGLISRNSVVSTERRNNLPFRVGSWASPTGRTYTFEQCLRENTDWRTKTKYKEMAWSDQQIANYPIQGLATADMVPLMVGLLYRFVYSEEMRALSHDKKPRLLMAVHDSVLLEVDNTTQHATMKAMKRLLESLPDQMKTLFKLDCKGLPFKVGVALGSNWEDMEDLTL